MVEDQEKALRSYTEVLGFVKKTDIPAGGFRWLTVVSPEGPEDVAKDLSESHLRGRNPRDGVCGGGRPGGVRETENAGGGVPVRACEDRRGDGCRF